MLALGKLFMGYEMRLLMASNDPPTCKETCGTRSHIGYSTILNLFALKTTDSISQFPPFLDSAFFW